MKFIKNSLKNNGGAQATYRPRLRNDLYCVEWDVKPIVYHTRRPTGDVENADLAEHCTVGERGKHRRPVVGDNVQLTALDDVQLLADVALAADIVAGRERRRSQLEHELCQQAGLTLAEDGDSTQRRRVHAGRDLGADALRQVTER